MNNPFNYQKLRNRLFNNSVYNTGIKGVVTIGSGPVGEDDFDEFLKGFGIAIYGPSEGIGVLIVGTGGWTETAIKEVLRVRAGKTLRVYSQEMFMSYLRTGVDPLNEKYELKMEYAHSNSALEFLIELGFNWPTTKAVPGPLGWNKMGLLSVWGYKVGGPGMEPQARRKILVNAFRKNVPGEDFATDDGDYGKNNSPERLKKIADIIASLCRLNKKKPGDFTAVIAEYESDLEWLKREVYMPAGFNFSWPDQN